MRLAVWAVIRYCTVFQGVTVECLWYLVGLVAEYV